MTRTHAVLLAIGDSQCAFIHPVDEQKHSVTRLCA